MNNTTLKIFMMPQEFPCGEKSSCCGPLGQSDQQIQTLKSGLEQELACDVEILNVKDEANITAYPQVLQLMNSLGPMALPIVLLDNQVVSMGQCQPEKVLAAIRTEQGQH